MRPLTAMVALVGTVGCSSAVQTARTRTCSNVETCLSVLCDPASDAPELAEALATLDAGHPAGPQGITHWASCARSALAEATAQPPKQCGLVRSPFSRWDLIAVGIGGDDIQRLVLGCAPRAAFLMASARSWGEDSAVRAVLREGMRSRNRWVYRFARRGLLSAGDVQALEETARALRSADPVETRQGD